MTVANSLPILNKFTSPNPQETQKIIGLAYLSYFIIQQSLLSSRVCI